MSEKEISNSSQTFERCPHDRENPYAQISRELLRDQTISFACRGLLCYLLSMKDGWKICAKQIINHCKGQYGRNSVYGLIKEGIEAGYIKAEKFRDGNLLRLKYYVSEFPKFKKCFRLPQNGDAETGHSENRDYKEEYIKEEHKEDVCTPPLAEPREPAQKVLKKEIPSLEAVCQQAVLSKKDWDLKEISEAHKILTDYKGLIRDPFQFIAGTIKKRRNSRKGESYAQQQNKGNNPCQKKGNRSSDECNANKSAPALRAPRSAKSLLELMTQPDLPIGSKDPKTSS